MTALLLTPEMAEHARFIEAGHGDLFDNLKARRAARMNGQVRVAAHNRRK